MFSSKRLSFFDWQIAQSLSRLWAGESQLSTIRRTSSLAESSTGSMAQAILSGSPAAKLLNRTQQKIAALEKTWYRANKDLLASRRERMAAHQEAFDIFIERYAAPPPSPKLASFPENEQPPCPPLPGRASEASAKANQADS